MESASTPDLPSYNPSGSPSKKRPDLSKAHGGHSSRPGSGFLAKVHRKHDAKYHPDRDPEQAPLLADPETEETPEPEQEPEAESEPAQTPKRDICMPFKLAAKKTGSTIKKGAFKTGQFMKKHKKILAFLALAVVLIAIIVLGVIFGLNYNQSRQKPKPEFCDSQQCIQAANNILGNMHPEIAEQVSTATLGNDKLAIDPCNHFDEFVCGGFEQFHELRADQNEVWTGQS